MGLMSCPETPVMNYQYSLRNNPAERSSHPFRGGSLQSPPKTTNKFKSHLIVLINLGRLNGNSKSRTTRRG